MSTKKGRREGGEEGEGEGEGRRRDKKKKERKEKKLLIGQPNNFLQKNERKIKTEKNLNNRYFPR